MLEVVLLSLVKLDLGATLFELHSEIVVIEYNWHESDNHSTPSTKLAPLIGKSNSSTGMIIPSIFNRTLGQVPL